MNIGRAVATTRGGDVASVRKVGPPLSSVMPGHADDERVAGRGLRVFGLPVARPIARRCNDDRAGPPCGAQHDLQADRRDLVWGQGTHKAQGLFQVRDPAPHPAQQRPIRARLVLQPQAQVEHRTVQRASPISGVS